MWTPVVDTRLGFRGGSGASRPSARSSAGFMYVVLTSGRWTHKIDGLVESDFVLAAKFDAV